MVAPGGAAGIFRGRLVVVYGTGNSGVFVYSPSPAAGTLVAAITGQAGTDSYGNTYPAGLTLFGTTFQTQSTPGTTRLKIDQYGEILGFNVYGAEVMHFDPGNGVYLIYQDLGSATQGGLISSIAVVAGTDAYGNAYLDGSTTYLPSATPVRACQNSNSLVTFYHASTMAGPWSQDGSIDSQSGTSGNDMHLSGGANGGDIYLGDVIGSAPGVGKVSMDASLVAANVAAFDPNASNTAETWHLATLATGWTERGTGFASLSYRLNAFGDLEFAGQITGTSIANGAQITTLPAGYYSTSYQFESSSIVISSANTLPSTGTPRLEVGTAGAVYIQGISTTAGAVTLSLDGVTIPISVP